MSAIKTEEAARKAAADQGLDVDRLSFVEGDDGWSWESIGDAPALGTTNLRPGDENVLASADGNGKKISNGGGAKVEAPPKLETPTKEDEAAAKAAAAAKSAEK